MSEGPQPPGTGGDHFDTIDAKLNVFALANGMDLSKGSDFRRLEWFTEGLERGILIEPSQSGDFRVEVRSWSTGSEEVRSSAPLGEGLSADDLVRLLDTAIGRANEL